MTETDLDQDLPEQPTPAPEVSPEAPKTPEPEKPAEPLSLRDQIKASVAKVNTDIQAKAQPKPETPAVEGERPRGPDGKFLPKDAAPEKVEQPKVDVKPQPGATPEAVQPKPQAKADAAPGTWKAEAKASWAQIPDHAKGEILRRESESAREVGKYQQQIQQINQAYGPIEQVIGPRRHLWRAQFGSEAEAIKRLTTLSDFASQDPTGFLQYYLNQPDVASRVDLQKIFGQQAPAGGESHPVVAALQQKINGLEQQLTGLVTSHQTAQQTTVQQEIAQFASATDANGQPLRPHFNALQQEIFDAVPALKAINPNLTTQQILDKAYRAAVAANEEVSAEVTRQTEQRIREQVEKEQRAAKAKLASKSLPTGAPPSNGQAGPIGQSDLRAELTRNFAAFARGDAQRI